MISRVRFIFHYWGDCTADLCCTSYRELSRWCQRRVMFFKRMYTLVMCVQVLYRTGYILAGVGGGGKAWIGQPDLKCTLKESFLTKATQKWISSWLPSSYSSSLIVPRSDPWSCLSTHGWPSHCAKEVFSTVGLNHGWVGSIGVWLRTVHPEYSSGSGWSRRSRSPFSSCSMNTLQIRVIWIRFG